MPNFAFDFVNRSVGEQDWNVQQIIETEIPAGDNVTAELTVNQNVELGVSVETVATPTRIAAGTLTYKSTTNNWMFQTKTPKEFHFSYDSFRRSVTLRSSLEVEQ